MTEKVGLFTDEFAAYMKEAPRSHLEFKSINGWWTPCIGLTGTYFAGRAEDNVVYRSGVRDYIAVVWRDRHGIRREQSVRRRTGST